MWTFKVPAGTAKAQLVETINATAHTYEGIPGLIRKYYGIAPDGTSLVGIYLWDSKAAADAFYTADWVAMATKRWAGPPHRQEWEAPMGGESAERRPGRAEEAAGPSREQRIGRIRRTGHHHGGGAEQKHLGNVVARRIDELRNEGAEQ